MNDPASRLRLLPDVSRETMECLDEFVLLLHKWNRKINLIGKGTSDDVWQRHIVDSIQVIELCPQPVDTWLDMGSGGGLPGLVVAIVAKEKYPEMNVVLMESDQRKAEFLRTASRELGLNTDVQIGRIESAEPCCAQVISARALAPLSVLLEYSERHRADATVCLFQKGRMVDREIEDARKEWSFEMSRITSMTDPESCVLAIKEFSRV